MRKYLLIIVLCIPSNEAISIEKQNTIGIYDMYFSAPKYANPFPYDITFKCNGLQYEWNGSFITIHAKSNFNDKECNKLVDKIPNIVCDFKKNFFNDSKQYFKYLIDNEIDNNIFNDIGTNNVSITSLKNYFLNKCFISTYDNPFDENPFKFKINDETFSWQDSKIHVDNYNSNSKYKKILKKVLINFNDDFKYFNYLLQSIGTIKFPKINIDYNNARQKDYKSLTFKTNVNNPLSKVVVIKDCLRTYRWNKNTIDIVFPP